MSTLAYSPRSWFFPFHVQSRGSSKIAEIIAGIQLNAMQHERDHAADWRLLTKALVEQMALDCQAQNWDGYGGKPITENAKSMAQLFIDSLPFDTPAPEPVPDPDGEIAFCWDYGPSRILTVTINSMGTISYAGLFGNGVKRYGMEPFTGDVPKTVFEAIKDLRD